MLDLSVFLVLFPFSSLFPPFFPPFLLLFPFFFPPFFQILTPYDEKNCQKMADVFVPRVDGQQPLVHPTGHQYSIFSALGCYVHHYAIDGHRAHSTEKVILMSGQQHFGEHCTLGSM